jgi:hypothetical protein
MNIIKTELRDKTGDDIERDILTIIDDAKILNYFQDYY